MNGCITVIACLVVLGIAIGLLVSFPELAVIGAACIVLLIIVRFVRAIRW